MSPFVTEALQVGRGFLPMLGIVCVNMILVGAFQMMICSGRDDDEHHALHGIVKGTLGTLAVAGAFAAFTAALGSR
ncbi:hypothetical protein EPO34_04295 [Patescibacteria group bacterium]|nr:MAG: hypothetical protein EPO34_04295 [Patescibacteria group bacterium]